MAQGSIVFTIGYEGVTFYFVPYELEGSSYADGNLSVTLSFYDSFVAETENGPQMVGLFKKKYRTVPDTYMRSISLGNTIEVLNPDTDEYEEICVYAKEIDDWGDVNGVIVNINGENVYEDERIFGYENDIYYVRMQDKAFIFIHTVQASEDDTVNILSIENGEVVKTEDDYYSLDPISIKGSVGAEEWMYDYAEKSIFDPTSFKAYVRYDMLGTTFETGTFAVTSEGKVEQLSKYLDFVRETPLTLKTDFKAGMIDPEHVFNEDTEVTGEFDIEVELKAGDQIYIKKTDGDRTVFFCTDNGEWGVFMLDEGEWMQINGVSILDIFEGVEMFD